MSTFSFPVRDLFVATGFATQTTTSTFISSATAGQVKVLKKDGSGVAAAGSDAYIVAKNGKNVFKASDVIKAGKVKSITKVDPVTVVPAYASFPLSIASVSAGDVFEGLVRIPEFIGRSVYDEYLAPFSYTYVSGATVDTVANELVKSLAFNFSLVEGNKSTGAYFKTGFKAIYATEAAALAAKASLTASDYIWVIANSKAYTVTLNTATTFATLATEKTDWSSEITAGTAVYLRTNPWFDFIKLAGTTPYIYIITKAQTATDMKMQGYDINFKVGLRILDGTTFAEDSTITVTNVGRVSSAGEGKRVRQLEIFSAGHTGDFYRGVGYPNNFSATYDALESVNYYMVNVEFYSTVEDVNTIAGGPSQKLLQIACADSTTATSVYNALAVLA